jgi:heme-degrading monooxygenase HmoA
MHARFNMLAGDPAMLDEATRYLEETVRPYVESQRGNRGIACLVNADLGTCIIASYWDSADDMTVSEQAVQVSRKEITELMRGSVTVEHYDVPVFARRSHPGRGAGVRLARLECPPGHIDAFIEVFRSTAVPQLTDMRGMASAHLLTDRTSGRCIVITAWEDIAALAASRAATAKIRADAAANMHLEVRAVEEYALVFSSVRDS